MKTRKQYRLASAGRVATAAVAIMVTTACLAGSPIGTDQAGINKQEAEAIAFNKTAPVVNPEADPAHAARIILLGTNGGPPVITRRSEPATLLVVDGKLYLVDAGAGVVHQLDKARFQPNAVRRIFITHNHLDHNAGLEPLVSEGWLLGNEGRGGVNNNTAPPVEIYGPPGTKQVFDATMDYVAVTARIFNSPRPKPLAMKMPEAIYQEHTVEASSTKPNTFYNDGTVKVTAVENTHFHFQPDSAAELAGDKSYAYRFDTPEGSIVFTGDTGPSAAVMKLAQGADVLVSEVLQPDEMQKEFGALNMPVAARDNLVKRLLRMHLTPEDIGKMAEAAHVKTVILTHIVPNEDKFLDAAKFTAGVKKYFSGTVILGQDLFEYDLFETGPANAQ